MKIFISQPMRDKTKVEILKERSKIVSELQDKYGKDLEILYSVISSKDDYEEIKNIPVWYLSHSIDLLSKADKVYFAKGWKNARGCRIEHKICEEYGIEIY